ncbi:hypothetical protein BDR05DRAFT_896897 [Suillus weaverae]|nr:hypothetical protein BDR05DRAFT_896897 [Suillus weaverae]
MLSFCRKYCELRVHTYDRSGSAISPYFHINKHKDAFVRIFSAIIFGDDECIGFDATVKIREHKLPAPIQVNDNTYEILDVVFSTHGLVGRGTVCYLTKKDNKEYIVKDHWVLGNVNDDDVLNEIVMMEKMKGVPGVPELVEYCRVVLSSGEVDNTRNYRYKEFPSLAGTWRTHVRLVMKPRGRRLQQFRTKKELVRALRDIAISKCLLVDEP